MTEERTMATEAPKGWRKAEHGGRWCLERWVEAGMDRGIEWRGGWRAFAICDTKEDADTVLALETRVARAEEALYEARRLIWDEARRQHAHHANTGMAERFEDCDCWPKARAVLALDQGAQEETTDVR